MIHRSALVVASLAASLTLAVALAAAGFAPGARTVSTDQAAAVSVEAAATVAPPLVQVDKVYVPAPVPQQTITVNRVVKTASGDSEGNEGGEND